MDALLSCISAHQDGRVAEAEALYVDFLRRHPGHTLAMQGLAILLGQTNRTDECISVMRQIIRITPDNPVIHNHLARALRYMNNIDEAIAHWTRAVELNPHYSDAFANMGDVFFEQAWLDKCVSCYRRALSIEPRSPTTHSKLLYAIHYHPAYDAKMILREHQRWARRFERSAPARRRHCDNDHDPARRLKIGYVSPAFVENAVSRFAVPLFRHHDHRLFDLYIYSDNVKVDAATERIRNTTDHWRVTAHLSAKQLAEQVRNDGIDIFVDLSQHAFGNRLLTFARKPAPVQVTWLGYPSTTGLKSMDYRLTDSHLDPPGITEADYSEKSIRLPRCFWCYDPPPQVSALCPLPAIRNKFVTLGCLNRFEKVSMESLLVWRQILQAIDGSRLLVHSRHGKHLKAVYQFFANGGIASHRVEIIGNRSVQEYYREFNRIDLSLDTFPYAGATVTCDSLWMGVPVITLVGRTSVGRSGASILKAVGLGEFIVTKPEQYRDLAVRLCRDEKRLQTLRVTMRDRMIASPLMDGKRFAGDMENIYRQMWIRWCSQSR